MKRAVQLIAATLLLFAFIVTASSCKTAPDGTRHYVGPSIGFTAGFNGVSVGVTIYGELPPAPIPTTSTNPTK